jgi:hypothetical protein
MVADCQLHKVPLTDEHECILCVVEENLNISRPLGSELYPALAAAYELGRREGRDDIYKRA